MQAGAQRDSRLQSASCWRIDRQSDLQKDECGIGTDPGDTFAKFEKVAMARLSREVVVGRLMIEAANRGGPKQKTPRCGAKCADL
jgi:hypothetical protein